MNRLSSLLCAAVVVSMAAAIPARGDNLMPNASFEVSRNLRHLTGSAGWGRFQMVDPRTLDDPTQRTWYIDDTTAWHGAQSVCIYQYLESQFVTVQPGKAYTISLYAKAGSPVTVRLKFISGDRTAYVPDGPFFMKEFKLTSQWQRLEMTGIPEGSEPCAYGLIVEVYGRDVPVWIDAVQVEQGDTATTFSPKERIEAATQIIDETPSIGIYFDDETPRLASRVYVDKPDSTNTTATLVHRILDHRGVEVDRVTRPVKLDERGVSVDEVALAFKSFGAFRVETDVVLGDKKETFAAESIYMFVPRIPSEFDDPKNSRFGSRFFLPVFPREGAPRFLPSWIGDEPDILAKAGGVAPYNYAVVTAMQARKLGMRHVRWSPVWRDVELERGRFEWAATDSYIDKLEELGFTPQFQFAQSPRWTHPGKPDDRVPPDDLSDWRNFLHAVATRYKGRFSAVEIWNESFSNFLGTAERYADLMKVAYQTLKEVDPAIQVLGISGSKPSYNFSMTKKILEIAGTQYMDAMSYHQKLFGEMPDEMTHPWEEELVKLHQAMARNGGDKPIWNTEEQCWSQPFYQKMIRGAGGYSKSVPAMNVVDAASGLVRYHVISIANNVVRFQYFGSYNARGSVISTWSGQDLIDFPLTESLYEPDYSPKPIAAAHAVLASQVAGETYKEELRFGDDDRGRAFLFDGDQGALAVVWALRARTHNGTLDWADGYRAVTVYDIMGNKLPPKMKIPLGAEPIYVRANSFDTLKATLSHAGLTQLPVIDKLSDTPLLATCLRSSGEQGGLELVTQVTNATPGPISPDVNIRLDGSRLRLEASQLKPGRIDSGRALAMHTPILDSQRPSPIRTTLTVDIQSEAKPATQTRPLELAYALRSRKAIVINGVLDDWDDRGTIHLGARRDVAPGLTWDGPDDLSADIRLRWDDRFLYIAARVTDDHLDRHANLKDIWNGTGLELFFDVDPFHDMGVTEYNDDDYHILFAPKTAADRGDVFTFAENSAETDLDGVMMKSQRTSRGYDMEIAIPRAMFDYEPWLGGAGIKFKKGHAFGFGIALNDAARERTARKSILIWGGTHNNWRDISNLATVIMVED